MMTDQDLLDRAGNFGVRNHTQRSWTMSESELIRFARVVESDSLHHAGGTYLKSDKGEILGQVFPLEPSGSNTLLVKLPRDTRNLSQSYVDYFKNMVSSVLPGRDVLLVGHDVSFAQITREDAIEYRLRGDLDEIK